MNTMTDAEILDWTLSFSRPKPRQVVKGPPMSVRKEPKHPPHVSKCEKGEKGEAHHWRIETPNGKRSEGVCKNCGVSQSFANSGEEMSPSDWYGWRQ